MDDLLFEGAGEAFDDAVGLGLADAGEGSSEAVEARLVLEVVGEALTAVIVAQFDAARRLGLAAAKAARHGLRRRGS